MDIKILVPSMGESIVEATVVHWYKKVGDPVQTGEPLLELETNKANLDIGAEQSGVLSQIEKQEGQDVRVGETLGTIAAGAQAESQPAPAAAPQKKPQEQPQTQAQQPAPKEAAQQPAPPTQPEAAPQPPATSPQPETAEEEKVTPVARRIAQENHLDLSRIRGSGAGGKIVKEDVEKALAQAAPPPPAQAPASEGEPAPESEGQPAPAAPAAAPEQATRLPAEASTTEGIRPVSPSMQAGQEERLRLSRRRRTIAQRLVETQNTAAMLTTFNDVDMSAVMRIRKERKEAFKEKYGVGLGIVSFFVKASILALKDFPQLNAEIQGEELVLKHYFNIGIAIGAEEGLVVPVLHNADRMSFVEIEKGIQEFSQKTKDHKLSLQDLSGSTFTITNGGVFGSLLSTPILNGPEAGILGLHRIEDRPIVVNGEMVIRPMMYMALSYDHRIVDGREAVQFLVRLKEAIQYPEIMLLGL